LFVLTKIDKEAAVPPVTHGSLGDHPEAIVAVAGLIVTGLLLVRRVPGALVLGIFFSTLLAAALGLVEPQEFAPPSFEIVGQADVVGALQWQLLPVLLALLMVDFFDTLGTVTGIAEQAGLQDPSGQIPGLRRVLLVD